MSLPAILAFAAALLRQWRRNRRERRELASLTAHERYELSFLGDVETEIAKPFWRA
jgi:uncharacterized protein YjiS (DUF1127 family)